MAHWTERYLGIPHRELGRSVKGCDCYGLVHLVYLAEKGINLPSYVGEYMSTKERQQIDELVNGAMVSSDWQKIDIIDYKPMDVIAFRTGDLIFHVGLIVDKKYMLHSRKDHSKVEDYNSAMWSSRTAGVYRYVG